MRLFTILLLALALVACGDDTNGGSDAAAGTSGGDDAGGMSGSGGATGGSGGSGTGGSDAGGMGGSGGAGNGSGGTGGSGGAGNGSGGTGGNTDDTPIAERESDGTFTCSVGAPLRTYEMTVWSYTGTDVVELPEGGTWLVRVESRPTEPFGQAPYSLIASKLDAAGELTADTTIAVDDIDMVLGTSALALSDGSLGIFWIEGGDLRFVALDDTGAVSIEPKTVASGDGLAEANGLNLALADDGAIAAVWNTMSNATFFAVTDESGASATPVAFAHATMVAPRIAAAADGTFVALWRNYDPEFMDPINVFFSRLDATGQELGEPAQVTQITEHTFGSPFGGLDVALQPVGDGYLVGWSEGNDGDFETGTGAYSVVRVQRVSATGEPEGESVLVDAQEDEVDQIEPSFVPWGDALALLWGRGSHIYICGGCIPDHSVNMVLIDPETLAPRSNIVQITPENGGLLNRVHALSGDDLLLALQIQFHVHFEPGFAAIHCE